GAYRDALPLMERGTDAALELGELGLAAVCIASCSGMRTALGELALAERDLVRLTELAERVGNTPMVVGVRALASFAVFYCRGTGLELAASAAAADVAPAFWRAAAHALGAVLFTFAGRDEDALRSLARALPAVERAGGGVLTYTALICRCCEALWRLGRNDFADVLEQHLRAKTLAGDFRYPGVDARRAMAQLCALTGRPGEAPQWFARARAILDEQGARPLRALVDLDEAWMEIRRGPHGDRGRARTLLDATTEQFQAIGMPGWIERAEALRAQCEEMGFEHRGSGLGEEKSITDADRVEAAGESPTARAGRRPPTAEPHSATAATFRCEGDYWTLIYEGLTARLKDLKELDHIAQLLRHSGREFHAVDLVQVQVSGTRDQVTEPRYLPPDARHLVPSNNQPLLDSQAKTAYWQRLDELREELAEAEQFNDTGHATRAREEIEALTPQLAAAVGLGGPERGGAADPARGPGRGTR